jgi:Nucleotidyltransferase of unknown function (DUF6036)
MTAIGREQLDEVLSALAELLSAANADAHLVVIGGSGLVAIGAITRGTRDVDVVALKRDDDLVSADPLPRPVAEAAALVARDFGLDANWLNAGPTSLLDLGLPPGFAKRLIARSYGSSLQVSFASRIDQVFFKLYAATDRREPRDFADLQSLEPTPDELRGAARWTRTHNAPGPFDDALARTLRDFGIQDEGRRV